jgi:bifunctional oligoribonuclease and PAP phosphatase NrnA
MERNVYREAGRRVSQWLRTMVLTHQRPDADAIGAAAACSRVLRAIGRDATAFIYEPVPPRYKFIDVIGGLRLWRSEDVRDLDSRFDGVLIVDTCSWSQLEPAAAFLKTSRLPKVVLDHHATHDQLTVNSTDDYYATDVTSASACGLVFEWCQAMGWPIDTGAGEAIFAGMAADTGWFRFSNTDGRTLRAAAALLDNCRLRPDILYAYLNASHSPARLRLTCEMLGTLRFQLDGAVAVVELTREMFEKAGASPNDAEELVNVPMEAGPVIVTVLMTDMGEGAVRANFRSKSPELCGRDIDVSAIARQFGGGGHRRAAGARIAGRLPEVRDQVVSAVLAALRERDDSQAPELPPPGRLTA